MTGFNLGADDYISKPFSLREVMVRVKAVLRRTASGNEKEAPQQLVYKGLILDMTKKKVSIDGIEVSLTKKEFEILLLLLQNHLNYPAMYYRSARSFFFLSLYCFLSLPFALWHFNIAGKRNTK